MLLTESLKYLSYGLLSNAALSLYYKAPRETLQDEFFLLHRWALKRAHTARLRKEAIERKSSTLFCACGNPAAYCIEGELFCGNCESIIRNEASQ